MPDERKSALIQSYAFGKLTDDEYAEVARLSLDDSEMFDELWVAAEQHEVLRNPSVRSRLLRSIEACNRPWWSGVWSWLSQPASRFALAGAVVLLLCVLIWRGPYFDQRRGSGTFNPSTVVTDSGTDLAAFFGLPLRDQLRIRFDLNRAHPTFRLGEAVRGTVRLRESAAVFILRRQSDGRVRIVFPTETSASADLQVGDTPIVFDAVIPTSELTKLQAVTLRIIALPAGSDLRAHSIDWSKLNRYSVREVAYNVEP